MSLDCFFVCCFFLIPEYKNVILTISGIVSEYIELTVSWKAIKCRNTCPNLLFMFDYLAMKQERKEMHKSVFGDVLLQRCTDVRHSSRFSEETGRIWVETIFEWWVAARIQEEATLFIHGWQLGQSAPLLIRFVKLAMRSLQRLKKRRDPVIFVVLDAVLFT